ncbi:hypothetical protein G7Y89_g4117 [Cudoniella acicularis]|uniref:Major facilitator superfamily (MFS) profile domain-containing protein n=1 Tax=Cudoniella acicularis TaxID=354080 RepID=A0A8H4RQW8_9HELO|nr:hypothetical protein G7Y89_g4117 [Cudoniella acicularis]
MHAKRQGRAWYHWYSAEDSPAERRLIVKLDLLIIPYAVIAYWIKYIDQSNISNAYVSGLKEDLNFESNQLVDLNAMYVTGAVVGQIPFTFLFPMFPMNWTIPGLEIGWGLFTLLQYRAQGFSELMAYRFLVGLFEAAFFPGVHYVLGAWYRGDELGRRGGVFYVGQMLGTLTAGLIQSGASANLNGLHGMAGWRWMFIISALMTIPVAIAGVFVWPGTPSKPNLLILTPSDLSLAISRLKAVSSDTSERPKETRLQLIKKIVSDWKIYALTFWAILFLECGFDFLWWLFALVENSDLLWGPSGAIAFAHAWNFIAMVILAVWNVPEAAKWFAFNSTYTQVAMSSVLYGWANDILRHDANERSFTLTFMNLVAQSTTAWTGILAFPTTEGPSFYLCGDWAVGEKGGEED